MTCPVIFVPYLQFISHFDQKFKFTKQIERTLA